MPFHDICSDSYAATHALLSNSLLASFYFMFDKLKDALRDLKAGVSLRRLIREDTGVEGCGWFAKHSSKKWHVSGNLFRTFIRITFAPLILFAKYFSSAISMVLPLPSVDSSDISRYFKTIGKVFKFFSKDDEESPLKLVSIPQVYLARGGQNAQPARYECSTLHPRWVLRVTHSASPELTLSHYEQVEWSDDVRKKGYTALSYAVDSKKEMRTHAGRSVILGEPTNKERREMAELYLLEYSRAYSVRARAEGTQFVWIDELCISDLSLVDSHEEMDLKEVNNQRGEELAKVADNFRVANTVNVFCHRVDCEHTTLDCVWGQRLWTISDIVHVQNVLRMIAREDADKNLFWSIEEVSGSRFKGEMKAHAELESLAELSTAFFLDVRVRKTL